jgi:hypothetical protein
LTVLYEDENWLCNNLIADADTIACKRFSDRSCPTVYLEIESHDQGEDKLFLHWRASTYLTNRSTNFW